MACALSQAGAMEKRRSGMPEKELSFSPMATTQEASTPSNGRLIARWWHPQAMIKRCISGALYSSLPEELVCCHTSLLAPQRESCIVVGVYWIKKSPAKKQEICVERWALYQV